MTRAAKEAVQYGSAVLLLVSGIVLTYISFLTPPEGEVSDSVLYFLAQCLIYASAIFGVSGYVNLQLDKRLGKAE